MLEQYGYVGLLLIAAVSLPLIILGTAGILTLLGIRPRKPYPTKYLPYECGRDTFGTSWIRFNFHYYYYALLFVVFDVETVFLYPWAVAYRQLALFGLIEMFIFILILVIGFVYAWKKRALEWR